MCSTVQKTGIIHFFLICSQLFFLNTYSLNQQLFWFSENEVFFGLWHPLNYRKGINQHHCWKWLAVITKRYGFIKRKIKMKPVKRQKKSIPSKMVIYNELLNDTWSPWTRYISQVFQASTFSKVPPILIASWFTRCVVIRSPPDFNLYGHWAAALYVMCLFYWRSQVLMTKGLNWGAGGSMKTTAWLLKSKKTQS